MPNRIVKTIVPHVPTTIAPIIDKEFVKDQVRYYNCQGRIFVADTYDAMFKPSNIAPKKQDYRNKQIRGT